jgi:serine O-acetyltransferase
MPDASAELLWLQLRAEVAEIARAEPLLAPGLQALVLDQKGLQQALAAILADRLATTHLPAPALAAALAEVLMGDAALEAAVQRDLRAILDRDPAARSAAQPLLHFKGFHALEAHRVAHALWTQGRRALAYHLQDRVSEVFGVDIHPAAVIGRGVFIDHGTGVVIGETAVVGDDVSLLHEVTLGGTGKEVGDRHPKIGNGVLIGAGAKILGNVTVGNGSKVAACSVVLADVPPRSTVAGIPAKVIGRPGSDEPGRQMDQTLDIDFVI